MDRFVTRQHRRVGIFGTGMRFMFVLAAALFVLGWPGVGEAGAQGEPLPPNFTWHTMTPIAQGTSGVIEFTIEDLNPDGSGYPHTFTLVDNDNSPDPNTKLYQINEDGSFGDEIVGSGVPITHSAGSVGCTIGLYESYPAIAFRVRVTNAFGLSDTLLAFVVVDRVNHAPTAADRQNDFYEDDPIVESSLLYSDWDGDPLTVTLVSLPERGDLYVGSIAPENLVTEPGASYPQGTQFVLDSGVEVDVMQPYGIADFASFQYKVSDQEFDSNIATQSFQLIRRDWPADMSDTPEIVTVYQGEGYTEFEIIARPILTPVELIRFRITDIPHPDEIGAVQIEVIPDSDIWMSVPYPVFHTGEAVDPILHDDGSVRFPIRIVNGNTPPTNPESILPVIAGRMYANQGAYGSWEQFSSIAVEIDPNSCNPEYLPEGSCHTSCPSCIPEGGDVYCGPPAGYALGFDGTASFADVGTLGSFGDMLETFTAELWIRTTDTTQISAPLKVIDTAGAAYDPVFAIETNRKVQPGGSLAYEPGVTLFYLRDAAGKRFARCIDADIYDDQWHHIAWRVVNSSENLMEVYVDGVLQPLLANGNSESPSAFRSWEQSLTVGAANNRGQLDSHFDGQVDEVRLWAIARSPTDINIWMHSPIQADAAGLHAAWRLDEADGILIADVRAEYPGGLVDGPQWIDSPTCAASLSGDVTDDGAVNLADLNMVLANFGQQTSQGDASGDGEVNLTDLNIVLGAFGSGGS